MKSVKGFTLIELLAVIVILAIIALIATPIILDVIDTAKKGAAESSALGYIDAVEKQVMFNQVDSSDISIIPGSYDADALKALGVEVKGEEPTKAYVVVDAKGAVTAATLEFSEYSVDYTFAGNKVKKTATKGTTTVTSATCSVDTTSKTVSCS